MAPRIGNNIPTTRSPPQREERGEENNLTYKVVLIGPSQVGKTWIVRHLLSPNLEADISNSPTLGVEVCPFVIAQQYLYNLWDVGETTLSSVQRYSVSADLAVIVVTNEEDIAHYVELLRQSDNCPYIVVIRGPVPHGDIPQGYVYIPYHQGPNNDGVLGIGDLCEAMVGYTVHP